MNVTSDGALRIGPRAAARPAVVVVERRDGGFESVPGARVEVPVAEPPKPYLARLVLLVPAEVISFYVATKGTASTGVLPWFGLVCVLLVVLVRWKATTVDGQTEWLNVAISAFSFALWVYATGGTLPGLGILETHKDVVPLLIAAWTFAVPYLYHGKEAPPAGG